MIGRCGLKGIGRGGFRERDGAADRVSILTAQAIAGRSRRMGISMGIRPYIDARTDSASPAGAGRAHCAASGAKRACDGIWSNPQLSTQRTPGARTFARVPELGHTMGTGRARPAAPPADDPKNISKVSLRL